MLYTNRKIYMSIILSVIIICCCIKPVGSGAFVISHDSYSISDGAENMSANEIIKALKLDSQQKAVQREEKSNLEYILISIAVILLTLLPAYGVFTHLKYRQVIKLWRVISYIHCLDGKKGNIIFYII